MASDLSDRRERDKAHLAAVEALCRHGVPRYVRRMSLRWRKLLGGLVMIVFVIAYALVAMALAQARVIQDSGKVLQALFFAVLGLGWILPLLPLIRWMEKR